MLCVLVRASERVSVGLWLSERYDGVVGEALGQGGRAVQSHGHGGDGITDDNVGCLQHLGVGGICGVSERERVYACAHGVFARWGRRLEACKHNSVCKGAALTQDNQESLSHTQAHI